MRQQALGRETDPFPHLANRDAPTGTHRVKEFLDHDGHLVRWNPVRLVALHDADRLGGGFAVGDIVRGRTDPTPALREIRPDVARLDQAYLNAERCDLVGQRLAVALERELAGAVEGLEREADDATDGADEDDPTRSLVAHRRQHSLHDPHAAP